MSEDLKSVRQKTLKDLIVTHLGCLRRRNEIELRSNLAKKDEMNLTSQDRNELEHARAAEEKARLEIRDYHVRNNDEAMERVVYLAALLLAQPKVGAAPVVRQCTE